MDSETSLVRSIANADAGVTERDMGGVGGNEILRPKDTTPSESRARPSTVPVGGRRFDRSVPIRRLWFADVDSDRPTDPRGPPPVIPTDWTVRRPDDVDGHANGRGGLPSASLTKHLPGLVPVRRGVRTGPTPAMPSPGGTRLKCDNL
jgi:hypothetical protein